MRLCSSHESVQLKLGHRCAFYQTVNIRLEELEKSLIDGRSFQKFEGRFKGGSRYDSLKVIVVRTVGDYMK